jgi:hypothetical protein
MFLLVEWPEDSPQVASNGPMVWHEGSDVVQMWLMYRPDGGERVPLRVVDWSWSSEASKGSSGWELINPSNSVNPTDSPTETYPSWRQKMNTQMTPRP